MTDNGAQSERQESRGTRIQVLGTNPDSPDKGRIFVWTKMGWFERIEDQSGGVAFTPVAQSEKELREYISRRDHPVELVPLRGKYRKMVSKEFIEQAPSHSTSPEYQSEVPSDEYDEQYHQHD